MVALAGRNEILLCQVELSQAQESRYIILLDTECLLQALSCTCKITFPKLGAAHQVIPDGVLGILVDELVCEKECLIVVVAAEICDREHVLGFASAKLQVRRRFQVGNGAIHLTFAQPRVPQAGPQLCVSRSEGGGSVQIIGGLIVLASLQMGLSSERQQLRILRALKKGGLQSVDCPLGLVVTHKRGCE